MVRRTKPMDVDDGVLLKPMPITPGQKVKIRYQGLLANSGSEEIYLHMGFGDSNKWQQVQDIEMSKGKDGTWEATIELLEDETPTLNMCFRDNAFNWDNNSGANWIYQIHNGRMVQRTLREF